MSEPASPATGTVEPTADGTFRWGRFVLLGVLFSIFATTAGLFAHHAEHGVLAVCGFIAVVTIASFVLSFVMEFLRAALPNGGRVTLLGVILIALALSLIWHSAHAAFWYQLIAYGGWFVVALGAAFDYHAEDAARERAVKEAADTPAS